jgi:hypothetical protein
MFGSAGWSLIDVCMDRNGGRASGCNVCLEIGEMVNNASLACRMFGRLCELRHVNAHRRYRGAVAADADPVIVSTVEIVNPSCHVSTRLGVTELLCLSFRNFTSGSLDPAIAQATTHVRCDQQPLIWLSALPVTSARRSVVGHACRP